MSRIASLKCPAKQPRDGCFWVEIHPLPFASEMYYSQLHMIPSVTFSNGEQRDGRLS